MNRIKLIKKNKSSLKKDENGYIVVETVGTFIPFLLLVISILSLVNIVTLQARVHNALTQAANTISMYCYILHTTGMSENLIMSDKKASASQESINAVFLGIESLSKGNGFDSDSAGRMLNTAESAISDPKAAVQSILNYGAGEARNRASAELVKPLVGRYLANGDMSGDEYLKSVRVKNFDFDQCIIIDRNGNVKITADYEIEYTFGVLRLPFGPRLRVTQTAITKAWLGGSGEGYWQ